MPFLSKLILAPRDGNKWEVASPLGYYTEDVLIRVPYGFVCDLESIPWWGRWLVPEDTQREPAAVVHDYLYRTQQFTRRKSDGIFYSALIDLGVERRTASTLYAGSRALGWAAWNRKRALLLSESE